MKSFYQFKNLIGTVYKKGNILFTNDGNTIISPIGNRISLFDLKRNSSTTLPIESKFDYNTVALSPNGCILVCVNDAGEAHLISMVTHSLIHRHSFKERVSYIKFSPDGKFLAVAKHSILYIFRSPGLHLSEFNPFILERSFRGTLSTISSISWCDDSRILAVGSRDGIVKIYAVPYLKGFRVCNLAAHSESLVTTVFDDNSLDVISISKNKRLCVWEASMEPSDLVESVPRNEQPSKKSKTDDNEDENDVIDESRGETDKLEAEVEEENKGKLSYTLMAKHWLVDDSTVEVTCAAYCKKIKMLVSGFSNGKFILHELPNANMIHSLSIIDSSVTNICINPTGDWIALGSEDHGQLVVWEWQSETFIMKQQGHSGGIISICYSPDGQMIGTGGNDGNVKLWNTSSGFSIITFNCHTSAVPAVVFTGNGKVVLSASVDGTVRAYDMTRYRNFRTFTATRPVQFVSLAVDSSGEFVAAGGQDVFDIYIWSMKVGRLLEVLGGHEGPVVSLAFSPSLSSSELVSGAWDSSVRIWNAIESNSNNEAIQVGVDALCVAFRPDGNEVCVSLRNGQLVFFDPKTSRQICSIDGRNDLDSGRSRHDLVTPKTLLKGKAFTTLCYSPDGKTVIAGGRSKNLCIYDVSSGILIKKIEITQNHSLDSMDDFVHKKNITEFGNIALVERREKLDAEIKLPGVRKGDNSLRNIKPEVRVTCVRFSPDGKDWAATTTEGILVYSTSSRHIFNPINLAEDVTPGVIHEILSQGNYSEALLKALRLNELPLTKHVVESIPPYCVSVCVETLPITYIDNLYKFLVHSLDTSNHLEFYLIWLKPLLNRSKPNPSLITHLQKNVTVLNRNLSKVCEFNKYSMNYLVNLSRKTEKVEELEPSEAEMD